MAKISYIYLILIAIILTSCYSTLTTKNKNENKVVKELDISPEKSISHNYTNITFSPSVIDHFIEDGLNLQVTPINANDLNIVTIEASYRTGDYEKEYIQERYDGNENHMSNSQRRYFNNLKRLLDKINQSFSEGNISSSLRRVLLDRVWGAKGYDGSEIEIVHNKISHSDPSMNPYHFNNEYLSVFKLTINNTSNEVKSINFDNLQVSNGNEILYPLNNDHLTNRIRDDNKIDNVHRFNLPNSMDITPNQRIIRYIASPPINYQEDIEVHYIDDKRNVYSYNYKTNIINKTSDFDFIKFKIEPSSFPSSRNSEYYYAVEHANKAFAISSDVLYLPIDNLNYPLTLCGASISSREDGSYFKCEIINVFNYPDKKIKF